MSISAPHVWVVGDAMADVTVTAPEFRPTQEDPAVRVFPLPNPDYPEKFTLVPGGAANLAANLVGLGCSVKFLTVIDSTRGFGTLLVNNLRQRFVDVVQVYPVSGGDPRGTTTKIRFVTHDRLVGRADLDCDSPGPVRPPIQEPERLPDAVVLSDYGRGVVDQDSARAWVRWAHSRGIHVYADPKDGRQNVWDGTPVDVMVCNWVEACNSRSGVIANIADDGWAKTIASSCLLAWGPFKRAVVVKRGVYGSVWIRRKLDETPETGLVPPVHPQKVFDVQGAGDTYLAGLVAARCRGASLADACLFASAAAGVAVGKPGTAVVAHTDVVDALKPITLLPVGVIDKDTAVVVASRLRSLGVRVGVIGGCFDLVGAHHVDMLTWCSVNYPNVFLIVAMNSDDSVRRLKGPRRPVRCADERSRTIAACRGVHGVVVFDEDDPCNILRWLRPSLFFKGGDYVGRDMPERSVGSVWGMDVVVTPKFTAVDTTQTITKILE